MRDQKAGHLIEVLATIGDPLYCSLLSGLDSYTTHKEMGWNISKDSGQYFVYPLTSLLLDLKASNIEEISLNK